jgi:hypothetical protein
MMARSKCFNQRPDTLMQDRRRQFDEIFLQRTVGPYMWVNNGPDSPERPLPVYPINGHRQTDPADPVSAQQATSARRTLKR